MTSCTVCTVSVSLLIVSAYSLVIYVRSLTPIRNTHDVVVHLKATSRASLIFICTKLHAVGDVLFHYELLAAQRCCNISVITLRSEVYITRLHSVLHQYGLTVSVCGSFGGCLHRSRTCVRLSGICYDI